MRRLPAALFAFSILFAGLWQALSSTANLPEWTLLRGRIAIASDSFVHSALDPLTDGGTYNLMDGDTETPTIFSFPSPHPHGAFLLVDLGLSHWPPENPGGALRPRTPQALFLSNGPCAKCSRSEFERYGRVKKASFQLLRRRANDPDAEFVIPETEVVSTQTITLPDKPGFQKIPLQAQPALTSAKYPENVFYMIGNIHVLDIYPGKQFPNRVAVSEIKYLDVEK